MDIQNIKQTLLTELSLLETELETVGKRDPDNAMDWVPTKEAGEVDSADRDAVADSLESLEENTAILTDLENRYNAIKKALIRIDKETYGTCTICNQPIEEDRLTANPAAETCKTHMNAAH